MIFSGLEYVGKKPFSDIIIHGMVRDDQGRKMSKTLGNGVDPLDVIAEYSLKMLHPIMPFVTEEIYTKLYNNDETIVTASWPH